MKDFHEIAEARGFSDKFYPYSVRGLNAMKVILKSLKWGAVFAVFRAVLYLIRKLSKLDTPDFSQVSLSDKPWFSLTKQEFNPDAITNDLQFKNLMFLLKNFSGSVLHILETICKYISVTLFIVALLAIPVWIVFAILRM